MREDIETLVPCPIARSSNHDAYNDICKATGKQCPYFIDEGMSVCKSKMKCLRYFSKRSGKIYFKEVVKLIFSDTKSAKAEHYKYTNTIRPSRHMHRDEVEHTVVDANEFLADLEDALKNHEDTRSADVQEESVAEECVSALEKYQKKM